MFRSIVSTYRDAFSGLNRAVWMLSIASLINRSGTMVMPFLVLFLTSRRGFTATEAGQALALYGLAAMAASYLGGRLSDRFGPIAVMKSSLLLTGVCFLVLGAMHGRLAISALIFLLGLVGELFRPANLAALTAVSTQEDRARSFGLLRLAVNLGMALGPTVGGFLAFYDYLWLFVVDGVTCILSAILLQRAFPRGLSAASAAARRAGAGGTPPPARSPFHDRVFLVMMALLFVMNLVTFQITSTFPLSLRDLYGFSEARIGMVMAVNALIIVLFEMVLVHRLAGRDPVRVTGVGAFLFCLGFSLLPLGSTFAFAAFTVVIWTMGEMLAFPMVTTASANRAPEELQGAYMGLLNFAFASAFVAAPLAGTWVYVNLGPRTLWFGCGAIGVVVWAGYEALAALSRPRAATPAAPREA
ncbi:MAG: MDR family MFS transporter [Thermoanaerobaculia bacterium]